MNRYWAFLSLIFLLSKASALEIELKIGTGIVDKNVVGESQVFPRDTPQLVGWSRVIGATEPMEIYHRWRFKKSEESLVELPIRSSYYRAWSHFSPNGKKGTWTLDVLDWEKNVLATTSFEIR